MIVARELGLRAVGMDIAMEYLEEQAKPRGLFQTPAKALSEMPLFTALLKPQSAPFHSS